MRRAPRGATTGGEFLPRIRHESVVELIHPQSPLTPAELDTLRDVIDEHTHYRMTDEQLSDVYEGSDVLAFGRDYGFRDAEVRTGVLDVLSRHLLGSGLPERGKELGDHADRFFQALRSRYAAA